MSLDCFCDYDPPTIYSASIRKARKEHRCDECGHLIRFGHKYVNVFGVWEGCASTFKTCEGCCDLRMWVKNNVPCFCWAHGNMLDDAASAVDEAFSRAPAEAVGLRFGFLRRRVALKSR